MRLLACSLLLAFAANCQPADPKLKFEVASVKRAEPEAIAVGQVRSTGGGPGQVDPGRYSRRSTTLASLILQAYGLKTYQLTGPAWMSSERYDVTAKIPEGGTKEQQAVMMQNLLAERFGLTVHRESKEMQVYELVLAKGGPKFKEYVPPPPPKEGEPPAPRAKATVDADGFPVLPAGSGMMMMSTNNRTMVGMHENLTMETLAIRMTGQVGRPVTDHTGLSGKYDVAAHWVADSLGGGNSSAGANPQALPEAEAGPNVFAALQAQLGLKLEPKKGTVEVLIVDHAEKVPTEN